MGVYCSLKIGSNELSWKGFIPDFAALLFDSSEYMSAKPYKDEDWVEHKLITSCGTAAKRLEAIGIGIDFLRKLHFRYFAFDFEEFKESLEYRCEHYILKKYDELQDLDRRINRMVELCTNFCFKSISEDEEFIKVMNAHKCEEKIEQELDKNIKSRNGSVKNKDITFKKIDMLEFSRSYLLEFLKKDPYLEYLEDFDGTGSKDLDLLYTIGLSIITSDPDIPVEFEFSEFIDSNTPLNQKEVEDLLLELKEEILSRAKHTAEAFSNIKPEKSSVVSNHSRLDQSSFHSTKEKGDLLEEIAVNIFEKEIGFTVKRKINRPGEEIDLMVLNKLDDPFWTALQSPIILIECKNQKKKVEPKDLRNFEVKLIDRKSLCRLGIIISTSGFTKGCYEVAARCSRDGFRLLLVDKKLLNLRIEEVLSTREWLEKIILDQC